MEYMDYDNQGQSSVNGCNGMLYTIKRGDTLYKLSRQYNVALSTIMNANPNVNVYNLQVGQRVCIPIQNMMNGDMETRPNRTQGEKENYYTGKKGDRYQNYECPACPDCPPQRECPAQRECPTCPPERECPTCPPQRECPAQRECPTCPPQRECPPQKECPACPECPTCPECPACPVCEKCPACPEPEPCPACPTCPEPEPCPACPEQVPCPECEKCPECPAQKPCPACKQKNTIIYIKPSCEKKIVKEKAECQMKKPCEMVKPSCGCPCEKMEPAYECPCKKMKPACGCEYEKMERAYECPCKKMKPACGCAYEKMEPAYECPCKKMRADDMDCPYNRKARYMNDVDDFDGRMMRRSYGRADYDDMYEGCPYANRGRYCRRCGYDMFTDTMPMRYEKEYSCGCEKKMERKADCGCEKKMERKADCGCEMKMERKADCGCKKACVYDKDYVDYCKDMYDGCFTKPMKKERVARTRYWDCDCDR